MFPERAREVINNLLQDRSPQVRNFEGGPRQLQCDVGAARLEKLNWIMLSILLLVIIKLLWK